jgi:heat-inducible transcriptional repressor
MKPKEMNGEEVLKLQTILNNNSLVVSDAISKCMEIISDITHYTSVVIGESSKNATLKQISIIPLDNNTDQDGYKKVVAVLVTNQGDVENKQVNVEGDIDLRELIQTSEIINKALIGTPIDKVNERLELDINPRIKDIIERYEEVCHFFSNTFYDFSVEKDKSDVFFSGKMNMLNMPEYQESDKLKEMIAKLENTDLVKKIKTDNDDIEVFIGEETEFDPDVTVIKTHYSVGNDEGTLAIIGTKRMEYNKVVTLLNYIKEYIDK